jgi:hypothetical protein
LVHFAFRTRHATVTRPFRACERVPLACHHDSAAARQVYLTVASRADRSGAWVWFGLVWQIDEQFHLSKTLHQITDSPPGQKTDQGTMEDDAETLEEEFRKTHFIG